jgi:dihydroorotate dehydrogenase (NAD+) catalytic subunit
MLAGATAVQVGTGNFIHPKATAEILQGIMIYLRGKGIHTVKSIVGKVCGK